MVDNVLYIIMVRNIGDMERVEDWSPIHYAVLEFFSNHDITVRPVSLAKNIDYTRNYVGQTCRELASIGLLVREDQFYSLTDKGRRFLDGDLPADDLPRLSE